MAKTNHKLIHKCLLYEILSAVVWRWTVVKRWDGQAVSWSGGELVRWVGQWRKENYTHFIHKWLIRENPKQLPCSYYYFEAYNRNQFYIPTSSTRPVSSSVWVHWTPKYDAHWTYVVFDMQHFADLTVVHSLFYCVMMLIY